MSSDSLVLHQHSVDMGNTPRLLDKNLDLIESRGALDVQSFDYHIESPQAFGLLLPRVEYATRVEHEVGSDTFPVIRDLLHVDTTSKIGRFFHAWHIEEPPHGDIHEGYKQAFVQQTGIAGEPNTEFITDSPYKKSIYAELTRIPVLLRSLTAAIFKMGWIHETTTKSGYIALRSDAKSVGLDSYADALGKILKQETTHQFLYELMFKELKLSLKENALANFVVRHFFSPVGANTTEQKAQFGQFMHDSKQTTKDILNVLSTNDMVAFLGKKTMDAIGAAYDECVLLAA